MARDKITFNFDHTVLCTTVRTGPNMVNGKDVVRAFPFSESTAHDIRCHNVIEDSTCSEITYTASGTLTAKEFYEEGLSPVLAPIISINSAKTRFIIQNPNSFQCSLNLTYLINSTEDTLNVNIDAGGTYTLTSVTVTDGNTYTLRGTLTSASNSANSSASTQFKYPGFSAFVPQLSWNSTRGFSLTNYSEFNSILSQAGLSANDIDVCLIIKNNHHKNANDKRLFKYNWVGNTGSFGSSLDYDFYGIDGLTLKNSLAYSSTGLIGGKPITNISRMTATNRPYYNKLGGGRGDDLTCIFFSIKFRYKLSGREFEYIRTSDPSNWLKYNPSTRTGVMCDTYRFNDTI